MLYRVISGTWSAIQEQTPLAVLVQDNWNDWFEFETAYTLYLTFSGKKHHIGSVKIGRFGMADGERRPPLSEEFLSLDDNYFSLGQDDTYYDRLNQVIPDERESFLNSLRDLAIAPSELLELALLERVTTVSLLRSVSTETVEQQFRRIARGGARLTPFEFTYSSGDREGSSIAISFEVKPESKPPTNIHVIIGSNGVGKTSLLNSMTRALVDQKSPPSEMGYFDQQGFTNVDSEKLFTNVVSVSFSAFDRFEPISVPARGSVLQYSYIGLKTIADDPFEQALIKSNRDLAMEFGKSIVECRQGARRIRWKSAVDRLSSDPLFRDWNIQRVLKADDDVRDSAKTAKKIFGELSSGHAIVLLTITRLVETVAEKTLVLLDEPEAHLHPPLLSAYIRALSDLLIDRNGVAIIATHSPVVLQEVPQSCVWKLRRSGNAVESERPLIETFGENVGILTREVFGLEVVDAGFHTMLSESVKQHSTYEGVLNEFNGQLGAEAKLIVRSLAATKEELF